LQKESLVIFSNRILAKYRELLFPAREGKEITGNFPSCVANSEVCPMCKQVYVQYDIEIGQVCKLFSKKHDVAMANKTVENNEGNVNGRF
jgi:hypothetical protein